MKRLFLFILLIIVLVFSVSMQSYAQITFGATSNKWSKENDTYRATNTTTQLTTATGKDTSEVFQLSDLDNNIKAKNVEGVNISTWLKSPDADSCDVNITLQGGYENDWNGANWVTIDGADNVTTANSVINEVQWVIAAADLTYPFYRILYAAAAGHTLEANTCTLHWFIWVNIEN